jgi:hypothetical protein
MPSSSTPTHPHLAQGLPPLRLRLGVDEVRQALDRRQVKLPMVERPGGKRPRGQSSNMCFWVPSAPVFNVKPKCFEQNS